MIYAIPVVGWFLGILFTAFVAVPFWFIWVQLGIADKFFYFIPEVYRTVGFWETVWIFVVVSILKLVFLPRLNVECNCKKEKKERERDD